MGLKERRAREREARRLHILAAARELLLKKGIQSTSIAQIAQTAELGGGTIYSYYQSKEEIYYALQEEGLAILHRDIRATADQNTGADEKLYQTGLAYLRFSREHKDYFDIINYFLASPTVLLGNELKDRIDHQGSRILTLIEEFIQLGVMAGTFKSVEPKKYAILFWGALHGLAQFRKLEQTVLAGENHEAVFTYAVARLVDGLK